MPAEYRQYVFRPPKGAADILLIRHGESEAAQPGRLFPMLDGLGDPALHENGQRQAVSVAARLANEPLAALYVTTLKRTHQTAAPLAKRLGLVPRVEGELREICLGEWDGGLYRAKVAARDPVFLRAVEHEEWGEIPGAETTAELHRRVGAALIAMAARHPDQRIAAVVHGGVIGAAMSIATGARPFAFNGAANGSISRLVITGKRMIACGFNDCSHLT